MNITCNKLKWIGVLAALVISLNSVSATPVAKGDKFPDLASCGLEGKVPNLAGKVTLVDFFASWCGPCQKSFPAMEKLYQEYAGKGLKIVAINLDKNPADMEGFLKAHPVKFAVLRDASYKLVNQVKIPTMPTSFLLDQSGKVYAVHHGFRGNETVKEYVKEINALLK